jgi:hypothetical protein
VEEGCGGEGVWQLGLRAGILTPPLPMVALLLMRLTWHSCVCSILPLDAHCLACVSVSMSVCALDLLCGASLRRKSFL